MLEINTYDFPVVSARIPGTLISLVYDSGYLKYQMIKDRHFQISHPVITKYSILKDPFTGIIDCKLCYWKSSYKLFAVDISKYEDEPKPSNLASIYRFLADNGFSVIPHEYENPPYVLTKESLKRNLDQFNLICPCKGLMIYEMHITVENSKINYKKQTILESDLLS